jgi:hypothetical protein
MRILQRIHYGREPRIPALHVMCAFFRGPVRSPGLGAGALWPVVAARDRIFYSRMDVTWIVVGLAGWALALVFVLLLMRMAGQQDRAARRSEKSLHPFSDVTITKIDGSGSTGGCGGESAGEACRTDTPRRSAVGTGATEPPKEVR